MANVRTRIRVRHPACSTTRLYYHYCHLCVYLIVIHTAVLAAKESKTAAITVPPTASPSVSPDPPTASPSVSPVPPTVSPSFPPSQYPTPIHLPSAPTRYPSTTQQLSKSNAPFNQPKSTINPTKLPTVGPASSPAELTSSLTGPTSSPTGPPTVLVDEELPTIRLVFQMMPGTILDEPNFIQTLVAFMDAFFADTNGDVLSEADVSYSPATGDGDATITCRWVGKPKDFPTVTSIKQKLGFWGIPDLEQELQKSGFDMLALYVQVDSETVQPVQQSSQSKNDDGSNNESNMSAVLVSSLILAAVAFFLVFAVIFFVSFRRHIANRQKTLSVKDSTVDQSDTPDDQNMSPRQTPESIMNGQYVASHLGPDMVSSLGEPSIPGILDADRSVVVSMLTDDNQSITLSRVRSNGSSAYDTIRLDSLLDGVKDRSHSIDLEDDNYNLPDGSIDYSLGDRL